MIRYFRLHKAAVNHLFSLRELLRLLHKKCLLGAMKTFDKSGILIAEGIDIRKPFYGN